LGRLTPRRVPEKKSKKVTNSHRKDMSPLIQGLNYRSACDGVESDPTRHGRVKLQGGSLRRLS